MKNTIDTQRYYLTSYKHSHNRSNNNKNRASVSRTSAVSKHQKETFYSRSILTWLILLILAIATTTFLMLIPDVNALQFPKSQQMDLMTINSGQPPIINNFNLTKGYTIQPILWNLTLPSSITFDNNGNMYVAEGGYTYGGLQPQPRIIKVQQNGNTSILLDRLLNGPITDIIFHSGKLYVSHRGEISTVDPSNGLIKDIIVGLPSIGDHFNNQITFGPKDGRLYFGQGTATNSGVVGEDNAAFGWLKIAPKFHDTPGKDITLVGQNFNSSNPLTMDPNQNKSTTGAFVAFGNSTTKGQTIKGDVKCNGCILSANPDGTDLKIVAWGLRNPYGLAFDKDGRNLIVSMNAADERGSRPIANDIDKVYRIDVSNPSNLGKFYGWPDYYGTAQPVTDPAFHSTRSNEPLQFLMLNHPPVEKQFALLPPVGVGSTQVAIINNTNNSKFGSIPGSSSTTNALIAEVGTATPITHSPTLIGPLNKLFAVGQKVVTVDLTTGTVTDFLSLKAPDPSFRPEGLRFNDKEGALYVASLGKNEVRTTLPDDTPLPMPTPWGYAHTGVVWKVTKTGATTPTAATINGATTTNATTARSPTGIPGVP